MRKLIIILITVFTVSCATSKKLNRISVGMSKQQAISLLGQPASVSSPGGGVEYLNYKFSETSDEAYYGITKPYYVLIVDGKVKQYGRHGDFGVTKDPTININSKSDINTTNNSVEKSNDEETKTEKMKKELVALKELLDSEIITQEEYDRKKKDILNRY